MSKKQKYSLTAGQRKELRHKHTDKTVPDEPQAEETVVKKPKFNWWIIPLLICAAALIVTAIVLPFTCSSYGSVKNPVARIELSNGMDLEFEIYEDTCPIAATNFIFLAKSGFFDGTIIYDAQQGWVRFGDFVSMSTYKRDDKKFMEGLEGFSEIHKNNKLSYRLYADTSPDASRYGEAGMLVFDYDQSSCQFFMSSDANLQVKNSPTVVGRYLNDTLDLLKEIVAMPLNEDSPHITYKNPMPTITIQDVKLYNLDNKKWKKFNFEEYMSTARDNQNSAIRNWYN